ncbi:MAG: hypothetical protein NW205_08580 [Hyphomicrobiaceae bacterium]|nr:hypothetical protein [Hyphomicrobiaceae bacterium]
MLTYLAILTCTFAGYAGAAPLSIGLAAVALAALSYAEHARLYRQADELGLGDVVEGVLWRSLLNSVVAAAASYGLGTLLRLA